MLGTLNGIGEGNAADSLRQEIFNSSEDTNKVIRLNLLAWKLMYENPDTCILLSNEALALSIQRNYEAGKIESLKYIGIFNHFQGNYEKALEKYREAIAISDLVDDNYGSAIIKGNVASIYQSQGDYPKSLNLYFEVLKTLESLGKKKGSATTLSHIGLNYLYGENFTEALNYFFRALELDKETKNTRGIAIRTSNIGNAYYEQAYEAFHSGDTSKAQLEYYPQALKYYVESNVLMEELENHNGYSINIGNMANIFADLAQIEKEIEVRDSLYQEALKFTFEALKIDEELGDKNGIVRNLNNIGSMYIQLKQFEKAKSYILRSVNLATEIGALKELSLVYKDLSAYYDKIGDFELSLINYKLYTEAKDSLFNESKSKEIGKLEAQYEMEQKQEEEKRIAEEKEMQLANQKSRRDNLQYSGIFIFVLLLFAFVFMSGKFSISEKVAEGLIFFTFLLLFEFCLVLLDPIIDKWSSGEPLYKLLFNALLAGAIFPLHAYFEGTLKKRVITGK
ncbi:MAG: tetratricopeptide repeat protein [Flavobacteriales bacterium]|nr:tetratricopeptide repeat protein [Flavobacteriales bacterium]